MGCFLWSGSRGGGDGGGGGLTREPRGSGEGARGEVGADDGGGRAGAEERAEEGGHCDVIEGGFRGWSGDEENKIVDGGGSWKMSDWIRCNVMRLRR